MQTTLSRILALTLVSACTAGCGDASSSAITPDPDAAQASPALVCRRMTTCLNQPTSGIDSCMDTLRDELGVSQQYLSDVANITDNCFAGVFEDRRMLIDLVDDGFRFPGRTCRLSDGASATERCRLGR